MHLSVASGISGKLWLISLQKDLFLMPKKKKKRKDKTRNAREADSG